MPFGNPLSGRAWPLPGLGLRGARLWGRGSAAGWARCPGEGGRGPARPGAPSLAQCPQPSPVPAPVPPVQPHCPGSASALPGAAWPWLPVRAPRSSARTWQLTWIPSLPATGVPTLEPGRCYLKSLFCLCMEKYYLL